MNNEKSIEILYEQFRKPLLRYITYKVNDRYVAEEILNDVFLKVSNSIATLEEKTKIQSWIYKIASNQIIDYYRKHKDILLDIEENFIVANNDADNVYKELECCLSSFLEQLPKQYSDSIKSVYFDELTQQEYAQKNNLNISTVKSHIKRGKESMKIFFEKCCEFEKDKFNNLADFSKK